MVFYRFLDGCKTMSICRNVLKSYTNKGDIMGYNEQEWRFILRALKCHSNLNLLSNDINSVNDIRYPLKTFNCILTRLRALCANICAIFSILMFLSITSRC